LQCVRVPNSGLPKRRVPIGHVAATAAALIGLATYATASEQTGRGDGDSYTAIIAGICRQYAAAITGMPVDLMFDQCMAERHCRRSVGSATYWCEPPQPMSWHGGGY
jgi:hypothetical protein